MLDAVSSREEVKETIDRNRLFRHRPILWPNSRRSIAKLETPTITFGLLKVGEGYSLYFPDDIDRDTSIPLGGNRYIQKASRYFHGTVLSDTRCSFIKSTNKRDRTRTCTPLAHHSPLCFLSPLTASPFINSRRKLFQSHVTNTGLIYDRFLLFSSFLVFPFFFFFLMKKQLLDNGNATRLFDVRFSRLFSNFPK